MDFEIIGDITNVEIIATGTGIRNRSKLQKKYGKGKWRKLKGIAQVQLPNGTIRLAEIHWYTATRKAKGKRQKAKVGEKGVSAFVNVLTKMRSAI